MSLGSWRVSIRIAARSAWRAKGRTALIAAMVGLPMMGMAAADTLHWTADLTIQEQVEREYGTADYAVARTADALGDGFAAPTSATTVDPDAMKERGLRSLRQAGATVSRVSWGSAVYRVAVASGGRPPTDGAGIRLVDLQRDVFDPMIVRRTGRLPVAPDEVMVSPKLLAASGADVGGTIELGEQGTDKNELSGRLFRVVGTAVEASASDSAIAFAPPSSVLADVPWPDESQWLVEKPPALTGAEFADVVARSGLAYRSIEELVATRKAIDEATKGAVDEAAVGTAVVVVGLAGLQIVLLSSAAFAVGARRQRRDLGLIAAQGGDRRQVRRVVLASALVIGAVASIVGVALGIALAAVLRGPIERTEFELYGPFQINPRDLAVIVVIGTATALIAAALPARTASRVPVLAALTGRRGQVRTSHRATVAGVVGIVAGFLIAAAGARIPANYNLILAGAVIAELGFALCAAALIGLAGRAARWLPLSLRLAVRDSSRNRGRSAPAVAAVMAALAATVGLATFLVSDDARSRDQFVPDRPANVVTAYWSTMTEPPALWAARDKVAQVLPGGRAHRVTKLGEPCDERGCTSVNVHHVVTVVDTWSAGGGSTTFTTSGAVAVGDAQLAGDLAGVPAGPEIQRALDEGRIVTFGFGDGETAVLETIYEGRRGGDGPGRRELPAVQLGDEVFTASVGAVMSPTTARRLGFPAKVQDLVWMTDRRPSDDELNEARAVLADAGLDEVTLVRSATYQSDLGLTLLALLGVSAIITLGATAIATGLAAAESRADLATLAAVGASPRVRRVLSMAQAMSIAGLGALLGVLAGLVPAYAILQARVDYPFVVPWGVLAGAVIGVPLIAALLAGLFTRSRLPMQARVE